MDADLLLTEDLSTLSDDQVVDCVVAYTAHLNAAEYRLIRYVDELDRRKPRGICGVDSIPAWLGYYCGLDGNAAREKLRVARALRDLPKTRDCFAKGEISYSKVRAITRIATPESEPLLLGYAQNATASQMERVVRGFRQMEKVNDPEQVLRQRRERGLKWHFDDDGMLVIEGRFPPEDGALILKAIEAVCDRRFREERAGESEDLMTRHHGRLEQDVERPVDARRADALLEIVEAGLANEEAELAGGDRTLVVMHVPVDEAQPQGAAAACAEPVFDPAARLRACELEHGPVVSRAAARRIACEASVTVHHEHRDGRVASIGRRSRTVPWWLRRALQHRDGGCRFPGCTRTRHVDAHHVVHWADGGETALDNLVLLCRHHHRLIHEETFHVSAEAPGAFRFTAADGRHLPEGFPQQPGDPGVLVRVNERRGLGIGRRTGCVGPGYTARPDYSVSVGAVWEKTHGRWEPTPRPHPTSCRFWPPGQED